MHRAGVQAVGDDFGTDAAGAVVDHELVLDAGQGVVQHRVAVPAREHLRVGLLVVEDRGELAERLEPVRQARHVVADALQRVGAGRERVPSAFGPAMIALMSLCTSSLPAVSMFRIGRPALPSEIQGSTFG